jgi:hypothetical protein
VLDALMILQNLLKACRYDRERSDRPTVAAKLLQREFE